ncbi:MAG: ABC transporter ATP-binding protein [Candidatus Methanofastidiosia archaeon]
MKAKQMLKKGNKYWKKQTTSLLLFIISTAVGAVTPFLIKDFIDSITESTGPLLILAVLILIAGSVSSITGFLGNYFFQVLAMEGVKDLQVEMYTKVQKMPVPTILEGKAGDTMSRITSDAQIVGQMISIGLPMLLLNIARFSIVIVVLILLDFKLALLTFTSIPFYYLVFKTFNKKLRDSTQKERVAFGQVVESLREKLQGLITIKLYNAQEVYQQQFKDDTGSWFGRIRKRLLHNTLSVNLIGYITRIMPLLVLLIGGYRVIAGAITLGTLVGFWQYMGGLYEPIKNLAEWNNGLQQAVSTGERISGILDMKEEKGGDSRLTKRDITISLKDVSFSYGDNKALKNISCDINYGSTTAIVGRSGAGKSTLINLLMGFYEPDSGVIQIDTTSLTDIELSSLRNTLSYVRQKDFIFNTSISENITLNRKISPEKVHEAAGCCLVEDFVDTLPQGYETQIGEKGFDLSDGQKQRIALARAFIRAPRILILDEATSAIDSENEAQIMKKIREKIEGTIIVVSHRLSTIKIADKILVLDNGQLVAQGDHKTLEQESDVYGQLFKEQLIK